VSRGDLQTQQAISPVHLTEHPQAPSIDVGEEMSAMPQHSLSELRHEPTGTQPNGAKRRRLTEPGGGASCTCNSAWICMRSFRYSSASLVVTRGLPLSCLLFCNTEVWEENYAEIDRANRVKGAQEPTSEYFISSVPEINSRRYRRLVIPQLFMPGAF